MEVELVRKDDAFLFEAIGSSSVPLAIDAAEAVGGSNKGARPMEMVLMGLGGCMSIDVILILKKQRQNLLDIRLKVSGDREQVGDTEKKIFKKIQIHYILKGDLDPDKVGKAIALSKEKYCSASAQLACSAEINTSFEIVD